MIDRTYGQRTHSTKMGSDKPTENTQKNLPKPKSLRFWWKKALLGVLSPWIKQLPDNDAARYGKLGYQVSKGGIRN